MGLVIEICCEVLAGSCHFFGGDVDLLDLILSSSPPLTFVALFDVRAVGDGRRGDGYDERGDGDDDAAPLDGMADGNVPFSIPFIVRF